MRLTPARLLLAAALVSGIASGAPTDLAAQDTTFDIEAMTPAEREAFGRAVRSYLLENPEVIREAIQVLEERRRLAEENTDRALVASHADALFNDGYSWVGGNPDGDVTIVEFSDYRCGFCKRVHPHIKQALELDPNIRLVIKEYPILGPDSVTAARMAMAALRVDPSLYGRLNDELMAFQGNLTETLAYRIAAQVGYDIAELKAIAQTDEIGEQVQRNYVLADTLGLQGTPSFVIGEQVIRGYIEVDQMLAAVDQARAAQN